MITQEFMKKVESYSAATRTENFVVMYDCRDILEVDFSEKIIDIEDYGDISFDEVNEEDFSFYSFSCVDVDLDDVYEYVKMLKKAKKTLETIENGKKSKLTFFVTDDNMIQYDLERFESLSDIADMRYGLSIWELKPIK